MSKFVFMFDLDSTITREEILPAIAKRVGLYKDMVALTESTMSGEMPFKQSFLNRVELLKEIPVVEVQNIVANVSLNDEIVEFIQRNKDRCYIVTGNIDIWIEKLMHRIGIEKNIYCSKALVNESGYLQDIVSIVDKDAVIRQMVMPFVAIGDGNNDAEMIERAEVGIGYGGVREIAPSVLECATHAVYNEHRLLRLLNKLV